MFLGVSVKGNNETLDPRGQSEGGGKQEYKGGEKFGGRSTDFTTSRRGSGGEVQVNACGKEGESFLFNPDS